MNAHPSRNAPPQRWLILFSVCLAGLIMPLSFTGPAVALTAIAKDLGGGLVALSWVTNAFMLTFGCSLMLAGALADRFGRKRVFICGLAALALSALLMSAAQDIMSFDAIRALQGISAAAALAGGTASLAQVFNGPERSKAFSLLGTTFGIGLAFGPLLAGALLFMLAFILIERRTTRPMLDLSLFRYPRFVGVQLLAAAPAYSYVVLLVLLPLRFIGIEGYSTVETGMMMLTLSAPMLALPLLTGAFAHRFSAGAVSSLGLLICAAGLAWLAHYAPGQSLARLLLPMLTIGCGISLPWGLMDGLAVSVVPRERAGMATGIFSTVRVAGEGIALAIVGALLALLVGRHLAPPTANAAGAHALAMGDMPRATALLNADAARLKHAYELAFQNLLYLLALTTLASAVIIFLFLRPPARETPSSAPRITDAP
ncbi:MULTISPECIES: MFS transporter [Serratia]|uniref:MFS transporter n=1 Tax=Serratia TaxID=613 RepID=UPI0018D49D12|nr:MFS transporter [Serratia marcescens]MBH2679605.1 MFS transporter [Serratia marcescens]